MASDSGSDTETNRIDIKFKTTTDTFSLNFKENAPILNVCYILSISIINGISFSIGTKARSRKTSAAA